MFNVSDLLVRLRLDNKQFNTGMEQSRGKLREMDVQAGALQKSMQFAGLMGVAFMGRQVLSAVTDLGKLGAQSIRVRESFEELTKQAGGSAAEIEAAIKRATGGAVSDMDIMLAANKGILLGLGAQADQWESLAEVARFRARAMGISMTQALSDISMGIGRESRLILDNLGIILDLDTTLGQYAATVGKTADELTAFERKQAIMNAVIQEGQAQIAAAGGIVSDLGDDIESAEAAIANMSAALGEKLAPAIAEVAKSIAEIAPALATIAEGPLVELVAGVTDAVQNISGELELFMAAGEGRITWLDALRADFEALRIEQEEGVEAANRYRNAIIEGGAEAANYQVRAIQATIEALELEIAAEKQAVEQGDLMAKSRLNLLQADLDAAKAELDLATAQRALAVSADEASGSERVLMEIIGAVPANARGAASAVATLTKETYGLATALYSASGYADELYEYRRELIPAEAVGDLQRIKEINEEIPDLIAEQERAAEAAAAEAERAWGNYFDKQEREWNRLRGIVTSALQPTAVTAEDMRLTEAGKYVDKWDENARRLDAIAERGFEEIRKHADWAGILKIPPGILSGSEADLKAWAARTSDSVRSLARPDLINLDAAVAAVEEYMRIEAAKEITIDLVVGEIAARGGLSEEEARRQVMAAYGIEEAAAEMPVALTLQEKGLETFVAEQLGGVVDVPITLSLAEEYAEDENSVGQQLVAGIMLSIQNAQVAATFLSIFKADIKNSAEAIQGQGQRIWNLILDGILEGMGATDLGDTLANWIGTQTDRAARGSEGGDQRGTYTQGTEGG